MALVPEFPRCRDQDRPNEEAPGIAPGGFCLVAGTCCEAIQDMMGELLMVT